jgi:hypothetical protein
MHELLNTRTKKTIRIPECVEELTPDHYAHMLKLAAKYLYCAQPNPLVFKTQLFAHITKLKMSFAFRFVDAETEAAVWSALTDKINLLDSFFDIDTDDDGHTTHTLQISTTRNMLPRYKSWHGPSDLINDITFKQFRNCLNALKMLQNPDITNAEMHRYSTDIFKSLYHSPKKKPERIPPHLLIHTNAWFSYWYQLITTTPLNINGEDIDFSILWKNDKKNEPESADKSGWLGILYSVAESGVFGKTADADNEKLFRVLLYLYKIKIAEIEQAEKMDKLKK